MTQNDQLRALADMWWEKAEHYRKASAPRLSSTLVVCQAELNAIIEQHQPTSLLDAIPEGWEFYQANQYIRNQHQVRLDKDTDQQSGIFLVGYGPTIEDALNDAIARVEQHTQNTTPTPTDTPHNHDQAGNQHPERDHAG